MKLAFLLLLAALTMNGCATAVLMEENDAAKARHDKAQFLERFQVTNAAREKEGLLPLDLCSEKYWLDHDWARKDKSCAPRIHRYENGDSTALNPPGMVLATTVATVPDSVQRIYEERQKLKDREEWVHTGAGAPR